MDRFLYGNGLRHERIKEKVSVLISCNGKKSLFVKNFTAK